MNGKALVLAALLSLATTASASLFNDAFASSKGQHHKSSKHYKSELETVELEATATKPTTSGTSPVAVPPSYFTFRSMPGGMWTGANIMVGAQNATLMVTVDPESAVSSIAWGLNSVYTPTMSALAVQEDILRYRDGSLKMVG